MVERLIIRFSFLRRSSLERDHRKRDSVDIDILFGQQTSFLIRCVINPPKSASHYLLTQQLASKGAKAKDVSYVVCVPTFCEHRDRNHAANMLSWLSTFADCRNHFTQFLGYICFLFVWIIALSFSQELGVDTDGPFLCWRIREFRQDLAAFVNRLILLLFGPFAFLLCDAAVVREQCFKIGLGSYYFLPLAADLLIKDLSDGRIVTNNNQHRRHTLLPGRSFLVVLKPFQPLTGDLN